MGQAKTRGSREQRILQAMSRQQDEAPINVPCQTCKAILNGFHLLQTSPAGAAWQKTCDCGAVTTALVQPKDGSVRRTFASTLGLAKEITGASKKTSVSFLEKTVDTVETGLVRI